MTFAQTTLLGAIAGSTIFLGLPVGRAQRPSARTRVGAVDALRRVLAFLFMDVGAEALGIVEAHLDAYKEHDASLWPVIGNFALLSAGFLAGVGGIATVQRWLGRPQAAPPLAGGESAAAMSAAELTEHRAAVSALERRRCRPGWSSPRPSGCTTSPRAWPSASRPRRARSALATVLIIGFALHNATEGFGIVGPLERRAPVVALARRRPASWPAAHLRRRDGRLPGHAATRSSCSSSPSPAA